MMTKGESNNIIILIFPRGRGSCAKAWTYNENAAVTWLKHTGLNFIQTFNIMKMQYFFSSCLDWDMYQTN